MKPEMGAVERAELDRASADLRDAAGTLENPFSIDFYGEAGVRFDAVDSAQLLDAITVALAHLEAIS